jgi:hypothetical protein
VTVTDGKEQETVDRRLRRLADATRDLAPPPGLADRLAQRASATRRRPRGLAAVVLPFGRPALVAAALAAAASVTLAIQVEGSADESIAEAVDQAWWEL